jgi:hypothetical protein
VEFSPDRVRRIVAAVRDGIPHTEIARAQGCGHAKIAEVIATHAPELVKRSGGALRTSIGGEP